MAQRRFNINLVRSRLGTVPQSLRECVHKSQPTIADLERSLRARLGGEIAQLVFARAAHCQISRIFDGRANIFVTQLCPDEDEELWVFEVPHQMLPVKISNRYGDVMAAQMCGEPAVIGLPESQIRSMPADVLLQAIRDGIAPFLEDGWRADEKHTSLFNIYLVRKLDDGSTKIRRLDLFEQKSVDLTDGTGQKGFSIILCWTEQAFDKRYSNGSLGDSTTTHQASTRQKVLSDLGDLLHSGAHSDVTLEVGGMLHVPAHKCILACRSMYFRAMFEQPMEESKQNVVHLDDTVGEATLKSLLEFLYTGRCTGVGATAPTDHKTKQQPPEWQSWIDLTVAADRFQVDELIAVCIPHLYSLLCVDSFVPTLRLADCLHLDDVLAHVVDFIKNDAKRAETIVASEAFQSLDKQQITSLMTAVLGGKKRKVDNSDKIDERDAKRAKLQ